MTHASEFKQPAVSAKSLGRKRRRLPPRNITETQNGDEFTITVRVRRRGVLFRLFWERDGVETESYPLCLPSDMPVTDVAMGDR